MDSSLEVGLETDAAADYQGVRDYRRAEKPEELVGDVDAQLLGVAFYPSQEVDWTSDIWKLNADLELLLGEVILQQVDEVYLGFVD